MNDLTVLIPTYNKNEEELYHLISFLNVQGNVIISNQNKKSCITSSKGTILISNITQGVSVNRNILLDNVKSGFCLLLDDDCRLIDNYEEIVMDTFKKNKDAEAIVFSRDSEDEMFFSVTLKDRRAKKFYQISKMGAPGIAIKTSAIKKYNLKFNEKLGFPNYFYNGEDSYFLYEMIKKKVILYTSSISIFKLLPSKGKSSYFTNYDNHFFESVGGVQFLLHRHICGLFFVKQAFYYRKKTRRSFFDILHCFINGKKKMRQYISLS